MNIFSVLKKIYQVAVEGTWDLGLTTTDEPDFGLHAVRWVKNPFKDRWFADPFPLHETAATLDVLVEEWKYTEKRGCISRITIDKTKMEITKSVRILENETHFSFPNIIRRDGHVFFFPENAEAGELALYEYLQEGDRTKKIKSLLNIGLADAEIFELNGNWLLMGTELPDVNGNILSVFYSEKEILGPYRRAGIVHFADCSARGAGKLFREGGKLIRVAQDCTGGYGRGLVFSEVVPAPCDPDVNFKEIFRFYPPSAVGRGIHTYNRLGGRGAIVDRKRFRHPLLGRLAESLRKIVVFSK